MRDASSAVQCTAMTALTNSLEFCNDSFQVEAERNAIMGVSFCLGFKKEVMSRIAPPSFVDRVSSHIGQRR